MKIEVTERDIRLGRKDPGSSTQCPVARAIKRALGIKTLHIGTDRMHSGALPECAVPSKAEKFIDRMCSVSDDIALQPFSFVLPEKTVRALRESR